MNKTVSVPIEKSEYRFNPELEEKLKRIGFNNYLFEHQYCLDGKGYHINLYPEQEGYSVQVTIIESSIDEMIKQLQRHIKKLEKIKKILEE